MACYGVGLVPDVKMKTVNVTQAFLQELTVQNTTQTNKIPSYGKGCTAGVGKLWPTG